MMQQQASKDDGLVQALSGLPAHALGVRRLGIVEQLLGDLDTATYGGEHYTMAKIVGLLRDETADDAAHLSELQRRAIKRSLDELVREQARMLPDRAAFMERAQNVTDVLGIC
jgi:hypothetical protein